MTMLAHAWVDSYRKTNPQGAAAMVNAVASSVLFDCGEYDQLPRCHGIELANSRSPYQNALLQFETPGRPYSHIVVLWADQPDGSAVLIGSQKVRSDNSWRTSPPFRVMRNEDKECFEYEGQCYEGSARWKHFCHLAALTVFMALGCSNVATVDNIPPAAINKKRAKSGKFPIMSHKTLVIVVDDKKASGQPMGGTHSSPRVHLRRGHIRNLGSGKRVWVQSCVVGSKHGIVTKDYRVTTRAAMQSAASAGENYRGI